MYSSPVATFSQRLMRSMLLLLPPLSCFSRVQLCVTPEMAAHQAPPSLGFSRQEHWSGLPFPSPMQESEKWKWSRSVGSDSSWPHGLQPTRLPRPWDSPGKNTGVGRHFLLQCKKVRSESEDTKLKVVHPQCLVHSLCTTATTSVLLLFSI